MDKVIYKLRKDSSIFLPIIFICIIALAIRFIGIWLFEDTPRGDTAWYHQSAIIFSETGRYLIPGSDSQSTAWRTPGYTILLGSVYWVFGVSHVVGALLNAVIGVISVCLVYILARYFLSNKLALICALIYSLWPSLLILYVPKLHIETMYGMFVLLVLIRTVVFLNAMCIRNAFLLGLAIGISLYVRPDMFLFFAVVFVICLASRVSISRSLLFTFFIFSVAFIILSPWIVRNYLVFNELIILGTSSGYNFAQQVLDPIGKTSSAAHYPPGVPQNVPYDHYEFYWREHGFTMWVNYIKSNFFEWLKLRWNVLYFLWEWDTPRHLSTLRYSWDALYPVFIATQVHYFSFLFFAGIGGTVSLCRIYKEWILRKTLPLVVVLLLGAIYCNLFYLMAFGHPRYHVVMIPIVIILSVIGGKWVFDKLLQLRSRE